MEISTLYRNLSVYFFDKTKNNTIAGNIVPQDGSTYTIGTASKPFSAIYADSLVGPVITSDGTLKINLSDSTKDYLDSKLLVSGPISKTINDVSGSKTMVLDINIGNGIEISSSALKIKIATTSPGLLLDASGLQVDTSVVRTTRTISTGDGLTGGGDLSANRTIAVDSSVVRTTRTISTGNGLTGGGDLSANRTISIDLAATNPGLEFSSSKLTAKTANGITRSADGIILDLSYAAVWSALHTFNNGITFGNGSTNTVTFNGTTNTIQTISNNSITLAPNGTGSVKLGGSGIFESLATFSQTLTAINGFRLYDYGSNKFELLLASMKTEKFSAQTFVSDNTRIAKGKTYWTVTSAVVQQDFTVPALTQNVDIWFEEPPEIIPGSDIFVFADVVEIKYINRSSGLSAVTMRGTIQTGVVKDTPNARQRWTFKNLEGGVSGDIVKAGTVAISYGRDLTRRGWVEINAVNSENGPFIQAGVWEGIPGSAPPNNFRFVPTVRLGNLKNTLNSTITSDIYGLIIGNSIYNDTDNVPFFNGVVMEPSQGARFYGYDIEMWDGSLKNSFYDQYTLWFNSSTVSGSIYWGSDSTNLPSSFTQITTDNSAEDYPSTINFRHHINKNSGIPVFIKSVSSSTNTQQARLVLTHNGISGYSTGVYAELLAVDTGWTRLRLRNNGVSVISSNLSATSDLVPSSTGALFAINGNHSTSQQLFVESGEPDRVTARLKSSTSATAPILRLQDDSDQVITDIYADGRYKHMGGQWRSLNLPDIATSRRLRITIYAATGAVRAINMLMKISVVAGSSANSYGFYYGQFTWTQNSTNTTTTLRGTPAQVVTSSAGVTITTPTISGNAVLIDIINVAAQLLNRNSMDYFYAAYNGPDLVITFTDLAA